MIIHKKKSKCKLFTNEHICSKNTIEKTLFSPNIHRIRLLDPRFGRSLVSKNPYNLLMDLEKVIFPNPRFEKQILQEFDKIETSFPRMGNFLNRFLSEWCSYTIEFFPNRAFPSRVVSELEFLRIVFSLNGRFVPEWGCFEWGKFPNG